VASRRLLHVLPEVFVGADAAAKLDGSRGFLYGEKRHRQVDILGFEPASKALGGPATLDDLVNRRLDRSEVHGWRIVGLAVEAADLTEGVEALLNGLVAGDVVVAPDNPGGAGGRSPTRERRILVHRGDSLAEVRTPGT
jgi:hypothetical protein